MTHAAVISVILPQPAQKQAAFNQIISDHSHLLLGRMGIPMGEGRTALVALTAAGRPEALDHLTDCLRALPGASVHRLSAEL